jgi:hypothetical protein
LELGLSKQAEYYNELLWMKLKHDDFPVGAKFPLWNENELHSMVQWKFHFGNRCFNLVKTGDNESNIEASVILSW